VTRHGLSPAGKPQLLGRAIKFTESACNLAN
jgi:hypothetical protein